MAMFHYDIQMVPGSTTSYSVDPPDLYIEAETEHEAVAKASEMYQLRAGETFVLINDDYKPASKVVKKEVPPTKGEF